MLLRGEIVYDDSNYRTLVGDGAAVFAEGEMRLLSRIGPPPGHGYRGVSMAAAGITVIPRSDWSARLKEQEKAKMRVSDYCTFPAWDQNGLPTCWANGPTQAMAIQRVIQGLPFKKLSACSIAVPISGGRQGGYEGEALDYAVKHGCASHDVWPENNTNKALMNDPKVIEDRKNHMALEWIDLGKNPENWATAALLGYPGAFAYNWMSHVMCSCDLVEIEPGSFGFRMRNSWKDSWGAKNEKGFGGFAVYREGKGTPNSGFCLRQVTAAIR